MVDIADLASWPELIAALLGEESGTPDSVSLALEAAARMGRAESVVNSATGAVRDQAQMISGHVREQPLIAVLLAAGIGYLLGRATR